MDWSAVGAILTGVGVLGGILVWAFDQRVRQQMDPLARDLRAHMDAETTQYNDVLLKLEAIHGDMKVNDVEHNAFDARLKRLEDRGK